MNRRTLLSAAAAAILAAGSFSASAAPLKELKIAATPVPQGEVLKFVKPILAKEGIDLKIIEFTDYIAPNAALDAKEVDVNFYQHQPFLDNAVRQRHINAVRVAPIYILPMAVYSQKLKSLKNVPNGARVSIPNDPSAAVPCFFSSPQVSLSCVPASAMKRLRLMLPRTRRS